MIDRIDTVCLFVADQDRAKAWYTEVLGFELCGDNPLAPGSTNRWLAVKPKGGEAQLILYLPDENWQHYRQVVGQSQAMTFHVSDMAALVADLKDKGVTFVQEPQFQGWGTFAIIEDSEGNRLILVETPRVE